MKISKKLLGLFMILFATVLLAACGEEDLPPVFAGVGNASIAVFDEFDPLAGVTATDVEDGDLTAAIEVTANAVDNLTAGTYAVSYSVEDSAGKCCDCNSFSNCEPTSTRRLSTCSISRRR